MKWPATLSFRHEAGEWPWAYEARQRFKLDEGALNLELDCRSLSHTPMPCGLGFHPYFPCGSGTVLDTDVEVAWTIDDKVLPVERVPAKVLEQRPDVFAAATEVAAASAEVGYQRAQRFPQIGLSGFIGKLNFSAGGVISFASSLICSKLPTCAIKGLSCGRAFASKMRATAFSSKTFAPKP